MDSYALWWLSGLGNVRANYYSWLATSLLDRLNVAGDARFLARISQYLWPLQQYVEAFASGDLPNNNNCQHFSVENDCIFSFPNCQGQEHNLAGGGCQPLVHAMMTSETAAVARLCELAGNATCTTRFSTLSAQFQARTLRLWNANISAFDTSNSSLAPHGAAPPGFSGVRELSSLSSPWYFSAVPAGSASLFSASWDTAFDPEGLAGPFGLRTAEKRNPAYSCWPKDCCYWGGPVWPFESSKAITAAANVLQSASLAPQVPQVTRERLFELLGNYTAMHLHWTITNFTTGLRANYSLLNESGFFLSGLGDTWIAEAGCADDGTWTDNPFGGYFYEHSTFADIVIQAVAGLVPRAAGAAPELAVQPLQPADASLAWWCLDGAVVNGRAVTVLWDIDGARYGRGAGLSVLLDGMVVAHAATTQGPPLVVSLL